MIVIRFGRSSSESYILAADVKKLSKQLILYFTDTCKNFKFTQFYDKSFMDLFKALIKNEEEFKKFLDMICLDLEEFLKLSTYICPLCFTSNLIKFIQETYLGIKASKKKQIKKK